MFTKRTTFVSLVALVVLVVPLLMGCGATPTPTATVVPATVAPKATTAPTAVPPTAAPTKVPPTNTPAPTPTKAPAVGGTLLYGMSAEFDTLDPALSTHLMMYQVFRYIGATLITQDPSTGKLVPYLAESWTVASDGLSVDFKIRKGVKFHDGSPMTAKDYAWTFTRILDPATKSSQVAGLGTVTAATAPDDYTLHLTLKTPSYPLLTVLSSCQFSPLSQKVVEQYGKDFGRHPVSVGPYIFKEWVTGDHVTVERNPDFNWSPPFLEPGAPNIQSIVFRFLPEYSTALAALEAGQVDYYYNLLAKDLSRIQATGKVQTFQSLYSVAFPGVFINVSKAPLDDVRVRKALNLALDRQAMIKANLQGQGIVQNGPASPATLGYWPGVEKIGYGYDLAQAKQLMKDAGYTASAGGMLEKNGQPCKFTLTSRSTDDMLGPSQAMQQMWKALGVDVSITQLPSANLVSAFLGGTYDMITMQPTAIDFDGLVGWFLSKAAGGMGIGMVNDSKLDTLLLSTRTTVDPDKRLAACGAAQQYMVEQALMVFVYVPYTFDILNNRVKGAVFDKNTRALWLTNAYIETK